MTFEEWWKGYCIIYDAARNAPVKMMLEDAWEVAYDEGWMDAKDDNSTWPA